MTLAGLYQSIKGRLQQVGIDSFAMDARLLMCHALQMTHEGFVLHNNRDISDAENAAIEMLVQMRLDGKPVAKIIGKKEFYGRDFITTEDTLDPRPDSETLIESVLQHCRGTRPPVILDLGTGTGCLVLTLLCEMPMAQAIAVDASPAALEVARRNAIALGVEDRVLFVQSDWLTDVAGSFDVVISNPPYISESEIPTLAREVRVYDPMAALVGGIDGLDPYRIIIPQLDGFLKPGGFVAFEIGQGQENDVMALLRDNGFGQVEARADLAGINRIVTGIQAPRG